VGARQSKVSLLRMIESPQRPTVRRMTALAFLTETPLVHVIMRMTIDAGLRRSVKGQCRMALRTADDLVEPRNGEIGQVVIEHDVGAPGLLAMTGFASALELAAVRVLTAMAACAILGQLLACNRCGVAGVAIDLGVRAEQRKLVLPGMIVIRYLPALVVVAIAALRAESRRVRIIGLVAALAVLRNLVFVIAAAMTGDAVDLVVHAQQFIAGFLEMVVLRRLPLLRHVALGAIFAA
jgi:hypothetical protein